MPEKGRKDSSTVDNIPVKRGEIEVDGRSLCVWPGADPSE
jgi:hypothetical protein